MSTKSSPKSLSKFSPYCIGIPSLSKSILDSDPTITLLQSVDYPRNSLGFQHYLHNIKRLLFPLTKKFDDKKKVYLVLNPFESFIDDYDKSIGDLSKKYLGIEVVSRGFYKLWELLFMFDLISTTDAGFISAHMGERQGSFIQSTMLFREKFAKNYKSDTMYVININPLFTDSKVIELDSATKTSFKNKLLLIDSDSVEKIKSKVDFLTADIEYDWVYEIIQEQSYSKLLLRQILTCIQVMAKGGSFVCKFYETFTTTSSKLICILSECFEKVFFVKPMTSRGSNPEKYAVCIGFKFDEPRVKKYTKILQQFIDKILANPKSYIGDIFNSYNIDKTILTRITQLNTDTGNVQFKEIGDIITFIESQNYYGDIYQNSREIQIEAAKFWTDLFFPTNSEFKENKSRSNDISFTSNKINTDKAVNLEKLLLL
jgi:23S rRNA U2552 (ribose-2'-O)-methylase RlmE/FtsJ